MRQINRFVMTSGFANQYGGLESMLYTRLVKQLWQKYPIDMFIFENGKPGTMEISVNGYHIETGEYVETKVIAVMESLDIEKFWLKVDDYGEEEGGLIGTFLFPDEY